MPLLKWSPFWKSDGKVPDDVDHMLLPTSYREEGQGYGWARPVEAKQAWEGSRATACHTPQHEGLAFQWRRSSSCAPKAVKGRRAFQPTRLYPVAVTSKDSVMAARKPRFFLTQI